MAVQYRSAKEGTRREAQECRGFEGPQHPNIFSVPMYWASVPYAGVGLGPRLTGSGGHSRAPAGGQPCGSVAIVLNSTHKWRSRMRRPLREAAKKALLDSPAAHLSARTKTNSITRETRNEAGQSKQLTHTNLTHGGLAEPSHPKLSPTTATQPWWRVLQEHSQAEAGANVREGKAAAAGGHTEEEPRQAA